MVQHFRGNVVSRTTLLLQYLARRGHMDRKTKVRQHEWGILRLGLEEEVLGLEIAMDDAMGVAVCDNVHHGAEEDRRVLLGVALALDDAIEKFAAAAEFLDVVQVAMVLQGLEKVDH
eukprot:scaffold238_cov532-Prasinococcus_capsulatus_cf.AAC.2